MIAIDAGHGGKDPGAVNDGGTPIKTDDTLEKTINLEAALTLKHYLSKRGFKTHMTRTDDTFVDLSERTKQAGLKGCELFVSIHHDVPWAKRPGVYFKTDPKSKAHHAASKKLTEEVAKALAEDAWTLPSSEARHKGLYIDYFNGPAILLELGATAPVTREERIHRVSLALVPLMEFLRAA